MLTIALMVTLLTGCLSTGATTAAPAVTSAAGETTAAPAAGETVEIEFFQYKREAQSTFDALIAKFQEANPTIKVTQNAPADAGTVIKTRVASGDVPTIIAVGADNLYTDLAKAGTFVDLTNAPELANVQSAYVDTIKAVSGLDQVYAIPYAANADAVIYNKKIFADNGVAVPKPGMNSSLQPKPSKKLVSRLSISPLVNPGRLFLPSMSLPPTQLIRISSRS